MISLVERTTVTAIVLQNSYIECCETTYLVARLAEAFGARSGWTTKAEISLSKRGLSA